MNSRLRALKFNMITGWAYELFALISGLILPRLILTTFGSSANGLTSSITQYLGFSVILRAGLGGVTRAALYRPLAEKNTEEVSSIMVATQNYMRKVAMIILGYIGVIAIAFPLITKSEYSWEMMFSMVLIIGSGVFVENFFGIKAKILLQADQKYYVQTLFSLASYVASFAISVILIKVGSSLTVVKIGATLGTFVSPLLLNIYVKRHFPLNMKAKPNDLAIKDRWSAFAQQMALVVNDNIPLVVMTMFVDLKEISVYTVYNMIVQNIKKIVESFVTGINSMFGDMLAKNEMERLQRYFKFIEWAFLATCTFLFSVTAVMLLPFIRIYTDSVTDVNYIRYSFALLISLMFYVRCIRLPYQMLVEAAGHFKQTRNGAIAEVVINIMLSVCLTYQFGIIGVLWGGLISALIRTVQYTLYATKRILDMSLFNVLRSFGIYFIAFAVTIIAFTLYKLPTPENYFTWCLTAVVVSLVIGVIMLAVSVLNNKEQFITLIRRIKKK